jgi:hypothetical protein
MFLYAVSPDPETGRSPSETCEQKCKSSRMWQFAVPHGLLSARPICVGCHSVGLPTIFAFRFVYLLIDDKKGALP